MDMDSDRIQDDRKSAISQHKSASEHISQSQHHSQINQQVEQHSSDVQYLGGEDEKGNQNAGEGAIQKQIQTEAAIENEDDARKAIQDWMKAPENREFVMNHNYVGTW